jgi:hypothetical protein
LSTAEAATAAAVGVEAPAVSAEAQAVSHVLLRRGDLHFSSTVSVWSGAVLVYAMWLRADVDSALLSECHQL